MKTGAHSPFVTTKNNVGTDRVYSEYSGTTTGTSTDYRSKPDI